MNDVMQAVGVFFGYAVLAVFAQNAVFTRGLGVSRLVQLVGDERTSSGWFALLLCVTQVLVAPLAFYAGGFIAAQSAGLIRTSSKSTPAMSPMHRARCSLICTRSTGMQKFLRPLAFRSPRCPQSSPRRRSMARRCRWGRCQRVSQLPH